MSAIPKLHMITNDTGMFHMYVYIPAGSIYEHPRLKGISHFLEHMLFKNRGESKNLGETLTSIGGKYNAATYKDATYFYVETKESEYKHVVDTLYQITRLIKFSSADILTERKVVLEELEQHSGDMPGNMTNVANSIILDKKNVYNNSVIGNRNTLTNMSVNDLKEYARKRYKHCMVMINCSTRKKHEIEKYVCGKFQISPKETFVLRESALAERGQLLEPKIILMQQEVKQFMTFMTFSMDPTMNAKDAIVLRFIQYCLTASGLNSILNKIIRVERGLVYTMASFIDPLRYISLYHIQFPSNSRQTDLIIALILDVLYAFKTIGLTKEEFAYYKRSYANTVRVKLSNESERTQFYGLSAFYGHVLDNKDVEKIIQHMTNEDVIETANKALDFKKLGVLSLGNYTDVDVMTDKIQQHIEHVEEKFSKQTQIQH